MFWWCMCRNYLGRCYYNISIVKQIIITSKYCKTNTKWNESSILHSGQVQRVSMTPKVRALVRVKVKDRARLSVAIRARKILTIRPRKRKRERAPARACVAPRGGKGVGLPPRHARKPDKSGKVATKALSHHGLTWKQGKYLCQIKKQLRSTGCLGCCYDHNEEKILKITKCVRARTKVVNM